MLRLRMASVVGAAGAVVASPVPKNTAWVFGSRVGLFHTDPPAGANCWTPWEFLRTGCGRSGMTYRLHSVAPLRTFTATTLPTDLQQEKVGLLAANSSHEEMGTYRTPSWSVGAAVTRSVMSCST